MALANIWGVLLVIVVFFNPFRVTILEANDNLALSQLAKTKAIPEFLRAEKNPFLPASIRSGQKTFFSARKYPFRAEKKPEQKKPVYCPHLTDFPGRKTVFLIHRGKKRFF